MSGLHDAVVVGGGPAGLAFACAAAARGLDVVVLERREGALDKACGEGLLPAGRRALEALGAAALVDPAGRWPIEELRWIDDDGASVAARLLGGGGLGIRRTALSAALRARAAALGAEVRTGAQVIAHRRGGDRIAAALAGGGEVAGRVLVAADGLASSVRRREGLDRPVSAALRFGLRRHFAIAPWGRAVEVHFARGVEAYVTPVGPGQVGVAFLFERGEGPRFDALLGRFPALSARFAGMRTIGDVRGAGPLARRASARVADRLVLLGDAAGYLDAVTGEGLSLGLGCAMDLAALLPEAIARGASAAALHGYEAAWRRRWRVYATWTTLMLQLARRPRLRGAALRLARTWRGAFEGIVSAAVS